jgi:hypothetical protein
MNFHFFLKIDFKTSQIYFFAEILLHQGRLENWTLHPLKTLGPGTSYQQAAGWS